MKEPEAITCPHCGKETPAGDVCRRCGKEIESAPGVEVHYKDFKGSELLDIKMTSPARQGDEKQALRPAEKNKETVDNASLSEKKRADNKTVLFFWATVIIFLSALAWYYLLNFLMKF